MRAIKRGEREAGFEKKSCAINGGTGGEKKGAQKGFVPEKWSPAKGIWWGGSGWGGPVRQGGPASKQGKKGGSLVRVKVATVKKECGWLISGGSGNI